MFEQTFKNIDDIFHKDAGCSSELDYTEQSSWMLFLKYLDDLEHEKSLEAQLMGEKYQHILDKKYRWGTWAAPKDSKGQFDHNNALTGDDLIDFVDGKLFPYLKGFKQRATSPNTIEYKIGETIYDGAAGSAGFLCEAYDYLRQGGSEKKKLSTSQLKTLQEKTFYAKEKKSLAYVIAIINMILHGIEAPNVIHTNTLSENLQDITPKNQHDIILANPPFGGKERPEVQQNFPIKTGETAFLFLQHFIKMLKPGGRAAIVIKNTFLSNTDNAAIALRKELLENCNLHTILDCPAKTFLGAGVKTVVLFFTKGEPTQKVWYYQLDVGRSLGKTNPLNDNDLKDFVKLQQTFKKSAKSWLLPVSKLDKTTWDLSVKNPNAGEEVALRSPQEIIAEIIALDKESEAILESIKELL